MNKEQLAMLLRGLFNDRTADTLLNGDTCHFSLNDLLIVTDAIQQGQMTGAMLEEGMAHIGLETQLLPVNPKVPNGDQVSYTRGSVPLYKLADAMNAAAMPGIQAPEGLRAASLSKTYGHIVVSFDTAPQAMAYRDRLLNAIQVAALAKPQAQ